jgi:hypothetical protein
MLAMLRGLFVIVAFAGLFSSRWDARAASIGELLHPSKKMACAPERLTETSVFTINLPAQHGDFLTVLLPQDDHRRESYVVYPRPRWPLKLSAEKFKSLKSVTWNAQDFIGIASFVDRVFVGGGRYTIVVGSKFDTPSPVVDGWCRLDYTEPAPFRSSTLPRPGPFIEGQAWNKMKCTPAVVTRDSTLTITLPFPHGNYLEISRKIDARPLHVVAPAQPVGVDSDDFVRMRSISLRVAEVQGSGGRGAEPVFVKPGIYTIRVGGGFEIDESTTDGWCRVKFTVPRHR